jgi:hypothetical protein
MTTELQNSDGDQPLTEDEESAECMFVFGKQ